MSSPHLLVFRVSFSISKFPFISGDHVNQFMSFLRGACIQLLDTPGIIEGAAQGKGRGRQVIAVARTAVILF